MLNVYFTAVDARLLNTQKQNVFDALTNSGFEPYQFDWTTGRTGGSGPGGAPPTQFSIIYSKSRPEFRFTFNFVDGVYLPHCSPWKGTRAATLGAASWTRCLAHIPVWANLVEDELKTPDPWKALPGLATTSAIALSSDVANTEFSHRETERLTKGLEEIRRLLIDAVAESKEQSKLINQQVNSLLEASKSMGRKDWINQAIGALITLSMTIGLQPEVTKEALEILRQTLTGIVHLVPHIVATGHQLM
jgi:hypothetical protein